MNIFKTFISIFLLFYSFQTFSQSSHTLEYFDKNRQPVLSKAEAKYYRIKKIDPQNPDKFSFEDYYVSTDKLQSTGAYESFNDKIKTGLWTYYYENDNKLSVALYLKDRLHGLYTSWFENGKIQEETNYIFGKRNGSQKLYHENGQVFIEMNYKADTAIGIRKSYYQTGQLKAEMNYISGKLEGEVKIYYEKGELKRKSIFKEDQEVSNQCFMENGEKKKCLNPLERKPIFKGGMQELTKFVNANLKYPRKAQKEKQEGKVYVSFIVDESGKVTNPIVIKGVSAELDDEALRVVSMMPPWLPGIVDDQPVKVKYTLPINFSLK